MKCLYCGRKIPTTERVKGKRLALKVVPFVCPRCNAHNPNVDSKHSPKFFRT